MSRRVPLERLHTSKVLTNHNSRYLLYFSINFIPMPQPVHWDSCESVFPAHSLLLKFPRPYRIITILALTQIFSVTCAPNPEPRALSFKLT